MSRSEISTPVRAGKGWRWLRTLSPWLAAEVALRRFATPAAASAKLSAVDLTEAEPLTFWVDGRRVRGFARGAGPPVVLLHGWGGQAAQWQAFAGPLANAGFRAIGIDAPAHGASSGRRATVLSFARALAAVARVEGPLSAVIAHSLGAAAATLALASGVAAERAVFLAPATDPRRHFEAYAAALGLDRDRMLRLAERRYGATWQQIAIVERARELSLPLLVFHDAGDRAVAIDEAEALVRNWREAELRITRGLGHTRLLRDAAVIAETVAFVRLALPRAAASAGAAAESSHAAS